VTPGILAERFPRDQSPYANKNRLKERKGMVLMLPGTATSEAAGLQFQCYLSVSLPDLSARVS